MNILDIIISKAYLALNRAKYAISEMSIRFKRIILHFDKVNLHFKTKANFSGLKTLYWFGDLVLMFLELMGIPEIYETIMDLFKFKTRPLYTSSFFALFSCRSSIRALSEYCNMFYTDMP